MGNSLSLVVSNIFMEHFEEVALDTADHKHTKWLRYINSTFVMCPQGPATSPPKKKKGGGRESERETN